MSAVLDDAPNFESRLGAYLVEGGRLDRSGLDRARRLAESSDERLSSLLPKLGLVSERDLASALSDLLRLP